MRKVLLTVWLVAASILSAHAQAGAGSIQGKVWLGAFMASGFVPLTVANVSLKSAPHTGAVRVDSSGLFRFDGLLPGTYTVRVEGYFAPVDTTIRVLDGPTPMLNVVVSPRCEVNKDCAERDLAIGKPRLLLQGGIAPVVYASDEQFGAAYGVQFVDFGCSGPGYECMVRYNQRIFEYLDGRYGVRWRRQVRKDVIGLRKRRK